MCIWKKRDDELQKVVKVQKQRGSSRDGFQEVGVKGLKSADGGAQFALCPGEEMSTETSWRLGGDTK